jgi:hypothetical protein
VTSSQARILAADVAAFLVGGVAIVVATRDEELRPEIARGWGPEVAGDGTGVTLCVGVAPGSRTRANLEGNGAIAATFSQPSTYRTVQLKGSALELREPPREQLARVQEHLEAFVDEVRQVGLDPERGRALLEPELLSVTFDVRELYDQTPGPNAGARL